MEILTYEELVESLSDLSVPNHGMDEDLRKIEVLIHKTVQGLTDLSELSRENLAGFIRENPDAVPLLAPVSAWDARNCAISCNTGWAVPDG